jgi:hypothetical protein
MNDIILKANKDNAERSSIHISLPNTGTYYFETVAALLSFDIPKTHYYMFNLISNCLIYEARERLVEMALDDPKATHVFFLDSDMVPPNNVISQLLSHNVDIASAKIFQRKFPFQPCMYGKLRVNRDFSFEMEGPMEPDKWPDQGIFEMEGVGMACALINLNVFRGLKKPWFFPMPGLGEDLAFCLKARKAGARIWVDFSLDCAHMGYFPVITASYKNAYAAWMSDPNNQGKLMFGGDGQ